MTIKEDSFEKFQRLFDELLITRSEILSKALREKGNPEESEYYQQLMKCDDMLGVPNE